MIAFRIMEAVKSEVLAGASMGSSLNASISSLADEMSRGFSVSALRQTRAARRSDGRAWGVGGSCRLRMGVVGAVH